MHTKPSQPATIMFPFPTPPSTFPPSESPFGTAACSHSYTQQYLLCQLSNLPLNPPLESLPGPPCQTCGRPDSTLYITINTNPNGNRGRPYYACPTCPMGSGFVTWADTRGVEAGNPTCECDGGGTWVCRRDSVGVDGRARGRARGTGFWKCAVGRCGFWGWAG